MPYVGGWAVPERYGSGEGNSEAPLLQRIFESLAAQRGDAYDQTTASIVGIENMAIARAITFDGWGANQRLINGFFPSTMTGSSGMLPRWERIFGIQPAPGDNHTLRRSRVAAKWAAIGQPNTLQPLSDALTAALGPIFVAITHRTLQQTSSFVGGITQPLAGGSHASTAPSVTLTGTPNGNYQLKFQITTNGGLGAGVFEWSINGGLTWVATGVTIAASVALGTTGLTALFSVGSYDTLMNYTALARPGTQWSSSLAHLGVQLTQLLPAYYSTTQPLISNVSNSGGLVKITTASPNTLVTATKHTIYGVTGTTEANGTSTITVIDSSNFTLNGSTFVHAYVSGGIIDARPTAAFYGLAAGVNTVLDPPVAAWTTFDFFVNSSHGAAEFRLDEPNLDLEALT